MREGEQLNDRQILEALEQGTGAARNKVLAYLYPLLYPMVRKYILSNDGSEESAKDIFQESLLAFFLQVEKGRFQGRSSIKTYVFAIARNFWLAEVRQRKKVATLQEKAEEITPLPDDTVEEMLSKRSSMKQMEILFGKLGPGCREILTYFFYDELPMAEIRQKLKVGSEQAVSNKKYRCLKKLAEIFQTAGITKGTI